MCAFKKVIKTIEVKVDVQKRFLGFKEILTTDVLVLSNSHFHSLLPHGNSP